MSRGPAGEDPASLTVVARRVLLDAAAALTEHHDAIVLVGAQAVYLRTEDTELAVASFTADGDLGLDPRRLVPAPLLEDSMRNAGFSRDGANGQSQPGTWFRSETVGEMTTPIPVDLLVPASLARGGRRSTTLPPHDSHAARRVAGLEAAVVDNGLLRVHSLDPDDERSVSMRVANIPALIISKAWKLGERLEGPSPSRAEAKDAGDLYRLMISSDLGSVHTMLLRLLGDATAGEATASGLDYLRKFFGRRGLPGIHLAQNALATAEDPTRVAELITTYVSELPRGS